MPTEEARPWRPLVPERTAELFLDLPCRWWVAGGWALDLHLGRQTRPHDDMDVVVLREDLPTLHQYLKGWTLMAADPPGTLRDWQSAEHLPEHIQDVWCRPPQTNAWALQVMVIDPVGGDWVYRRHRQIRRPLATISGSASTAGMPVLAPEIQLLYKSHQPRTKDQQDFDVVIEALLIDQREWLRDALQVVELDHPWLQRL